MGCWGAAIACDDGFWDLVSDLQTTLKWNHYDGNPETMITAKHFNDHVEIISQRIRYGFSANYETCWFQVLAFLVMKIGGRMSEEMRRWCILASRVENDYLGLEGWKNQTLVEERVKSLQKFEKEIDDYYCGQVKIGREQEDY